MKQLFTVMAAAMFCTSAWAQTETTPENADTIRVGNIVIVKKGGNKSTAPADSEKSSEKNNADNGYWSHSRKSKSNVSTNWAILDIGFNNYIDETNYANAGSYVYNRPGAAPLGKSDFALNAGKSINVNIWLFMQKINLIKQHVFLKYGIGVELNNYRYKSSVSYLNENPFITGASPAPIVFRDSVTFTKNKLAADYLSVPVMLSFQTGKSHNRGVNISFGVSAGYLYSQRNKQASEARGKMTTKGNFDLEQFKLAYVAELGLGPVRLYGTYSPKSMYQRGLDIRPYTLGLRFSNW